MDYNCSVYDEFTTFVQLVIPTSKGLDIICGRPMETNPFGLPSWAPDWWSDVSPHRRNTRIFHFRYCSTDAARDSQAVWSVNEIDQGVLILKTEVYS